jgi:hypothetical protein
VADDDETWGKSSTRSRRASVCEESPNGWWSWQITDGGGSPRCLGNQAKKGRKLHHLRVFIAGGERESGREPAHWQRGTSGLPVRLDHGLHHHPLFWIADLLTSIEVLNHGMSQNHYRAALFIDPAQ